MAVIWIWIKPGADDKNLEEEYLEGIRWWLTRLILNTYWVGCPRVFTLQKMGFHLLNRLKYALDTTRMPCLSKIYPVDGGWDILQKRRGNRKRRSWFWDRGLRCLYKLVLVVQENFVQTCLFFIVFDDKKRIV